MDWGCLQFTLRGRLQAFFLWASNSNNDAVEVATAQGHKNSIQSFQMRNNFEKKIKKITFLLTLQHHEISSVYWQEKLKAWLNTYVVLAFVSLQSPTIDFVAYISRISITLLWEAFSHTHKSSASYARTVDLNDWWVNHLLFISFISITQF